jgi:hypothetical protein
MTEGAGTVIGVAGRPWRATVTGWGAVLPHDGGAPLDWAVAADDGWHVPREERGVRQHLVRDMPVVETAMWVSGGDAIHRAYAVADGGGLTVVEVENRSPRPFAVAFTRRDVLTARPIPAVPVVGLDLPAGSWVAPVGHRARIRVALRHRSGAAASLPERLPSADQVARGWEQQVSIGARFEQPGTGIVPVAALRARVLLDGPGDPAHDRVSFLLAVRELAELSALPDISPAAVSTVVEHVARGAHRAPVVDWTVEAAVEAGAHVLAAMGERRAAGDARRVWLALAPCGERTEPPAGATALAWLRRAFATPSRDGSVDLLARPLPPPWRGGNVEAHGLRLLGGTVSLAVRWHGTNPALLWETDGLERLTCSGLDPGWSTTQARGEALLSPTER